MNKPKQKPAMNGTAHSADHTPKTDRRIQLPILVKAAVRTPPTAAKGDDDLMSQGQKPT